LYTAPGIFTASGTGSGQAAAVNQNGTLNSASAPAPTGSIISLFMTGEGQTTPAGVNGKPATAPYPKPIFGPGVRIGGQPAVVTYYGGAPGEVAGLMQVNVQIPLSIQPGNAVPVLVQMGNASSQTSATIAVSAQ
jgi:uncharacterized protein (TIGR03437 family)